MRGPGPNSPCPVSLSLVRRGSPALALWRVLHAGRRLARCHAASPEVPGVCEEKLGKRKATQLGNLLRACPEEENLSQGVRACQQHPNLRGAAHSAPGGQEEGPQSSWHHPGGWFARRSVLFCFHAVQKEIWKPGINNQTPTKLFLGLRGSGGGSSPYHLAQPCPLCQAQRRMTLGNQHKPYLTLLFG